MIRVVHLLPWLALVAALSGCALVRKKDPAPKDSGAISSEVEAGFRQRWVEKRREELGAQGMAPELARAQAAREFAERHPHTQPARP